MDIKTRAAQPGKSPIFFSLMITTAVLLIVINVATAVYQSGSASDAAGRDIYTLATDTP